MDYLVNKVDSGDMDKEELTAHASTIMWEIIDQTFTWVGMTDRFTVLQEVKQ